MIEWQAAELSWFPSKLISANFSSWISRLALKTQRVAPNWGELGIEVGRADPSRTISSKY